VSDEYGVGDYVAALGPLVILFGLLALVVRVGVFDRMRDRAVDRRLGRGQGALMRRALEDGVIPPGADVAAWRTDVSNTKVPTMGSVLSYLVVMILVALYLLFVAATSDNAHEALLNLIPALIITAFAVWLFAKTRQTVRQRQRLIRLLNDEG